ncbi:MAG: ribosomal RNA small subunit methyltransferase E [Myxococcaceae bacterium]
MKRLLVPGAKEGGLTVDGPRFHYLVRVLRLGEGDSLELFDGRGWAFDARLTSLSEASAVLTLGAAREAPRPRALTVVQGLPKGDKLEWVLQKGTELGVSGFVPAACARSVVKLDEKSAASRLDRWTRIVEEAARQCGRADVPTVAPPAPLLEAVAALEGAPAVFVLDEAERAVSLSQAFAPLADSRTPVALVIGPEGGLERTEVDALVARGATPVTLGRLVLRTETAALAAVSVLRHLDGDLG